MKQFILLFCSIYFNFFISNAQVVVNKHWVSKTALPDNINLSVSTMDTQGNLIVTSNTLNSQGNTDIITTKYSPSGNILWQQSHNGNANGADYGVAVECDVNDNVYVAGAITGLYGYIHFGVLKYSASGSLIWSVFWQGASSLYDLPSCLRTDIFGNVYVAGGSLTINNLMDFSIVKVNPTGQVVWIAYYDYSGNNDAATDVNVGVNGNVLVSGASASESNSWDYATIELNHIDGSIINTNRQSALGIGLDKPMAMDRDNLGNIYITGYTENAGDKDIQTIKLNSSFELEWAAQFDGENLEDIGRSIGLDNSGNVYVTGYTSKSQGGRDFITIKYDAYGNEVWARRNSAPNSLDIAEAVSLKVGLNGHLYVTGSCQNNGNLDFLTIDYSLEGDVKWKQYYSGEGVGNDVSSDITIDDKGNIFVTGMSTAAGNIKRLTTIRYSSFMPAQNVLTNGTDLYLDDQIIVKFRPSLVNTQFVDNLQLQFAPINDVLSNEVITTLNTKLGIDLRHKDVNLVKIFTRLTTSKTTSIDRNGNEIPLDPFWSAFLLTLPQGTDEAACVYALHDLNYELEIAELHYLYYASYIPNDPFIDIQSSIVPTTTYPAANINLEPAWDIEKGYINIKVGVLDGAIDWTHEDFGDGSFAGSKIVGGWNFVNNIPISETNSFDPHGTACAGIIGALSNNNLGTAGIAGGDVEYGNTGVQLFSLAVTDGIDFISMVPLANAIVEGAANSQGFGYGLNVENSSWSGPSYSNLIALAVRTCSQHKCLFVASRGNNYNIDSNASDLIEARYPACLPDTWVFSIGGSGNDGFPKKYNDNGDNKYQTIYGLGMDVIAPGSLDIVVTTLANGQDAYGDVSDPKYTEFSGTSSATPHASGIGALMMSRHHMNSGYPNNLDGDDVEILLEKYANDRVGPVPYDNYVFPSGYDERSGWGLINAGAAMQMINKPQYWVQHNTAPDVDNLSVSGEQNFWVLENSLGIAAGTYVAKLYTLNRTYNETVPAGTQIIDYWGRGFSSTGVSAANHNTGAPYCAYNFTVNGTTITAVTTTYCWHILTNSLGQQMDVWYPAPNNLLSADFSIHVYDPNAVTSIIEPNLGNEFLKIYPNPCNDIFWMGFITKGSFDVNFQLTNSLGQIIDKRTLINCAPGSHLEYLDTSKYPSGIYYLHFRSEGAIETRKILIQH